MKTDRWFAVLSVALVAACSNTHSAPPASEAVEHEDIRKIAADQKVRLADAIDSAVASGRGEAIEAGLEGEVADGRRDVFIEVMLLDAEGNAVEVKVSPADGRVLSVEKDSDPKEGAELQAVRAKLPAGHLSLADVVRRAGGGNIVSAAFEAGGKLGVHASVRVVAGADVHAISIDAKSGAVLAKRTETAETEEDEDDEEGEEEDER